MNFDASTIIALLGALGIGTVAGSIVQQLLSNWHDSSIQKFQMKKEAFVSAIAFTSGIGHRAVNFLLTHTVTEDTLNQIELVGHKAELRAALAGAILVSSPSLRKKLEQSDDLIQKLSETVQKLLKAGTQVPELNQELLQRKNELEKWEGEIIEGMRKELGLE